MLCPKCQYQQDDRNQECLRCGIIFAKYYQRQQQQSAASPGEIVTDDCSQNSIWHLLFFTPPHVNYISLSGRVLLYIVLIILGMKFIFASIESNYAGHSFMHLINLPFHEAGHLLFRPFGSFVTSLGGSLGQLLMPLICFGVLLLQTRDTFGASVALWWFGQNFFDLAPYINDARAGVLPLLGGNVGHSAPYGFHDWEYLLTESGLLAYDHVIAQMSVVVGTGIMLISLLWGGVLLFRQYKEC